MTSLYIHIPFCTHRCGYCDFNTYAGLQEMIPAYSQAICKELSIIPRLVKTPITIHTIYFGGGTPSLVPASALNAILSAVRMNYSLVESPEITLEANPGTLSAEYLSEIRQLGVDRISLGMQSASQQELTLLERQHTLDDVIRSVDWVRKAGIADVNLDLIFGLPGQSLSTWMGSLETALSLHPEHLSLYALTLEEGTPLRRKIEAGMIPAPDADLAADMYESATETLAATGYVQYEISNWAKREENGQTHICMHNLQYWHNLPYLGVGAGAHGYIDQCRTVNVATPLGYINRLNKPHPSTVISGFRFPGTPVTIQSLPVDKDAEIAETMMLGLRLVQEGVSASEFQQRFGMSLQDRYSSQIDRLISLGLLEWVDAPTLRLRLTVKGRLLGNQVFLEFI